MTYKTEAIFLDIDGTLVDSNEYHVQAWDRAFEAAQVSVSAEQIRKQIGKGADMLIPALAPDLDESVRSRITKKHAAVFRSEFLYLVRPFPCARDLIESLYRDGIKVVLASSADQAEVDYYVKLLRVEELLTATTSASDVERSKPAGDIFASALKAVAPITAASSLAVGDTPYDVEAANQCGVRTIALRSGSFTDAELQGAGAIALYDDVQDLLKSYPRSMLGDGISATR
jgi:beta-phosphoglucomutase-like phosphatase (HAD superfamily)